MKDGNSFIRRKWTTLFRQTIDIFIYRILETEREAENLHLQGNNEKACEMIQNLINQEHFDDSEKGWYLQTKSPIYVADSKIDATKIQLTAFRLNNNFKNQFKVLYTKKLVISMKTEIKEFESIYRSLRIMKTLVLP